MKGIYGDIQRSQPKILFESFVRMILRKKLITDFHDSLWAGHRGIWATFMKLKENYWWPHMYKDITKFVETGEVCQRYSTIRYRDELKPTYSSSMHYKWMVDLVRRHLGRSNAIFSTSKGRPYKPT